jgi:hypothetical protein
MTQATVATLLLAELFGNILQKRKILVKVSRALAYILYVVTVLFNLTQLMPLKVHDQSGVSRGEIVPCPLRRNEAHNLSL